METILSSGPVGRDGQWTGVIYESLCLKKSLMQRAIVLEKSGGFCPRKYYQLVNGHAANVTSYGD